MSLLGSIPLKLISPFVCIGEFGECLKNIFSSLLPLQLVTELVWHLIAILDPSRCITIQQYIRRKLRCVWDRSRALLVAVDNNLIMSTTRILKNSYLLAHEGCVESIPTDLTLMNHTFLLLHGHIPNLPSSEAYGSDAALLDPLIRKPCGNAPLTCRSQSKSLNLVLVPINLNHPFCMLIFRFTLIKTH